jgi:hypothetical protein
MPFGYGPAAKLVSLARRVRGSLRLVFVGEGSALELVSRSARDFEAVIDGSPLAPQSQRWLREADAVLSVMDREAGVAADRAGRPLFVVDSLLWMRAEVPDALRGARAYFAQAFPSPEPVPYTPPPTWVGPLVAPRAQVLSRGADLVVNLGGSAAPDDRRALFAAYARLALRAVAAAGLLERFPRVRVIGGEPAIGALAGVADDPRIECGSLSPDDARACTAEAAALLTAPGLTATLEAFCDRTPTWFLPPQNYSQWCTLRRLRARGLADGACHWEDDPAMPRLPERMPAAAHASAAEPIRRACEDPQAIDRVAASLAGVGRESGERAARQSVFFCSLGPCGLERIAASLRRLARGDSREPAQGLPHPKPISRSQPWTS